MRKIYLGPPGTGKTTTLLNIVDNFLEAGVPPDRIGYFAFTRKAAHEAADRASDRFGMARSDLPYFRTLHSLALTTLGGGTNTLMKKNDYKELSEWLKVPLFTTNNPKEHGPFNDIGFRDKHLQIISMARITCKSLREVYDTSTARFHTDYAMMNKVAAGLKQYKKDEGLLDFTDLLEQFVARDVAPKLEVLVIDEAQDLSPLQWQMVNAMAAKARFTYLAGDDDQAIYRWAGADVNYFINLDGDVEVLSHSYRMPARIHRVSQGIISKVRNRRPKVFTPRDEQGVLQIHGHSAEVDLSEGEWLLLGYTKQMTTKLEKEVRQRGYRYDYAASSFDITHDAMKAAHLWENLRKGGRLRKEDVLLILKFMESHWAAGRIEYGAKAKLEKSNDDEWHSLESLTENYGLLTKAPWDEALNMLPEEVRMYLRNCERNGESMETKPRIKISTIHASKGGEADHVMLLTNRPLPRRNQIIWRNDPVVLEEDLHRSFYVGATRARKSLHLVMPMRNKGYFISTE